jgi:hypothetical protein
MQNRVSIITSNNAREFNRLLSEAFENGGRVVGGIKSIPKGDDTRYDCEYDYVTFVSYDQLL